MPERTFVERAVAHADVNALRVALYQATRDPELAAIAPRRTYGAAADTVDLSDADARLVRAKAVDYLLAGAASEDDLGPPSSDEVDALIQMAEARPLDAEDLALRRHIPAFADMPFRARWSADPVVPDGYRVAIVGAGMAGVAMGVQLAQLGIPFTIYERRAEVGGVWSTNTYPDVRVDTLSATYEYGFEKKYPWAEYFSRQADVRAYIEHVARKHGVHEHIAFGSDVRSARFDDATRRWTLTVHGADSTVTDVEAHVVVAASGVFATPRELSVAGADGFAGEIVHTARWHDGVAYAGKDVAIIGNGSTGVQLLARVAEQAASVTVYQRTPQWISPRTNYGVPIAEELQWLIQEMPFYWSWNRYTAAMGTIELRAVLTPDEQWIAGGGRVSERNDGLRELLTRYIEHQVGGRRDLVDRLVPEYAPMTRRPVVDNDWYASLTRDHVELVTTEIDRIDETAVVTTDGTAREADLIIAAVGFQTEKYLWPTEYHGTGGLSLEDAWSAQGAQAHLGMTVPGFPNLFLLYGPNSQPVSGGAGLPSWFEIWSRYVAEGVVAMLENGHASMVVRQDAFEHYNEQLHKEAQKLIYLSEHGAMKKNYYVNEFGRLQMNAPWTGEQFFAMCASLRAADFDFTPEGGHPS
ncbi:FAD-dependent oxidoreductase [Pimelobacter simplex]|uniref:flavin-containing monooxygenase n=1 Tax=Nocardioides simplex TaxID=2045 RepID=UPI003AAB70C0